LQAFFQEFPVFPVAAPTKTGFHVPTQINIKTSIRWRSPPTRSVDLGRCLSLLYELAKDGPVSLGRDDVPPAGLIKPAQIDAVGAGELFVPPEAGGFMHRAARILCVQGTQTEGPRFRPVGTLACRFFHLEQSSAQGFVDDRPKRSVEPVCQLAALLENVFVQIDRGSQIVIIASFKMMSGRHTFTMWIAFWGQMSTQVEQAWEVLMFLSRRSRKSPMRP
jgi:hypothetical protein